MKAVSYALFGFGFALILIGSLGLIGSAINKLRKQEGEQTSCLKAIEEETINIGDDDFNDYTSSQAAWNPTIKSQRISEDEATTLSSCSYLYARPL